MSSGLGLNYSVVLDAVGAVNDTFAPVALKI